MTTRNFTDPVTGADPLLDALTAARGRREQADHALRLLIGYGQHATWPEPYRLGELAKAAGLSTSTARRACETHDIQEVGEITGTAALVPWSWQIVVLATSKLLYTSPDPQA